MRAAHPLHSGHKLFGDVGPDGLVAELQLCVVLGVKRLQDANHFTVLTRASRLLLMGEVKPSA